MSNTIPKSSTLMKPTASSQAKSSKHETKANNNNKNNTNNKNENKIKTQTKSTLMKPTASYSLKNPTPPLPPQKQCLHVSPTELILQKTPAGSHARSDDFICPLCHSIVWSEVNHAWSDDPVYQYNDLAWKQRHNL